MTDSGLHGHVVVDLRRNSKTEEVSVIGRDRGANDRLDAALIALKRGILDG